MVACFFQPACPKAATVMADLLFIDDQSDVAVPLCEDHLWKYRHDSSVLKVSVVLALS